MGLERYRAFTDELRARLEDDGPRLLRDNALTARLWEPDDDLDRCAASSARTGARRRAGGLAIAERELRGRRPDLAWPGFDAVRARLLQDSGGI